MILRIDAPHFAQYSRSAHLGLDLALNKCYPYKMESRTLKMKPLIPYKDLKALMDSDPLLKAIADDRIAYFNRWKSLLGPSLMGGIKIGARLGLN
jgi:hypothetical protein